MTATLNVSTNQEAFDAVVRHLKTMARRSSNASHTCLYRAPDGNRCAIGALIDDDQYDPILDEHGVRARQLCEKGLLDIGIIDIELLMALQSVHDDFLNWNPREGKFIGWDLLRITAAIHRLDTSVLN